MRGPHPLRRSFAFAWDGLAEGAARDRNLRIHLALGVLAGAFVARAPLAPVERALLLVCVAAVIAAEVLNSALEAAVDLASPSWHERARVAKDSAAAAVLALAAGSVLALAAIALPRLGELGGVVRDLWLPAAGAGATSIAALRLPLARGHARLDAVLLVAGVAGLALVAPGARSQAGTAAAALCLAVAAAGARAARRHPR